MLTINKKTQRPARGNSSYIAMAILGVLCVTGSFAIGIRSAGDMKAITTSEAGDVLSGDMNDNGRLDREDISIVLEIVHGYREPTAKQLRADPSGDGHLTLDDAMRMLHDLEAL